MHLDDKEYKKISKAMAKHFDSFDLDPLFLAWTMFQDWDAERIRSFGATAIALMVIYTERAEGDFSHADAAVRMLSGKLIAHTDIGRELSNQYRFLS